MLLINPPGLVEPRGFSHVAVARLGTLIEVAGQTPVDEHGRVVGEDLESQVRAATSNVARALSAAGAGWEHVVRRTIYTTLPTEFQTIAAAVGSVTGAAPLPPQSIVGVAGLVRPEFLVEMEVTAVLPPEPQAG